MKSIKDNRIVVDLNKIQWAKFYYINQHGQGLNFLPNYPTFRGVMVHLDDLALTLDGHNKETIGERFRRRGEQLDFWTPELKFKLQANACLLYTGKKAISLWAAWRAKMYGKSKS